MACTVAALYVEAGGVYSGLPDVQMWAVDRDARFYPGPHPVVAHPPCARWCRLAALVESQGGRVRGDDDGCFRAALGAVRKWGGVLEHPAFSAAWPAFDLPTPHIGGAWQRGICGGWSCHVEQVHYGHRARKATWLYAFDVTWLPSLHWGPGEATATVTSSARAPGTKIPEMPKSERKATPLPFRDMLLEIARSARQPA